MLQFFTKDKTYIWTIEEHSFDSFKYGDINTVGIPWNPEPYLWAVAYLYIDGDMIGSGIVDGYRHSKNDNTSNLDLYPLIQDLKSDFCTNVEYDDDIANVIEDIIAQYTASVTSPIVYLKEKNLTGINFKYAFSDQTLLEAYQFIVNKFIGTNSSVVIENDGGIVIRNTPTIHELTYWNDILKLAYEKDTSEIVNYIKFTNGGAINEIYQDSASIAIYGKKVLYVSDGRFLHLEAVDEYCNNILQTKWKARVKVDSIKTLRSDMRVWDKVSISNWEKNFDDALYINKITCKDDKSYTLDIGTKESRKDLLQT